MTFLTPKKLKELTKRKQPKAQKRCLRKNDIDFFEDANGNPIVPVPIRRVSQVSQSVSAPRFEALRKAG